MSEHDIIKMIPSTAKTLLRNISFKKMKRTTRQKGRYYYRGKLYDCLRVIIDVNEHTIKFARELKVGYGMRNESLTYDYKNGTVLKYFHEPSAYDADYNKVQYPFIDDEAMHFMESTMQDKYFPTVEDFAKIKELKEHFYEDAKAWENELYQKEQERRKKSWNEWQAKLKVIQKKSSGKHTSF
ncbi:hypothetical protein BZF66_05115 [Salmonella enterica]|nr:hypothetical protein CPT_Munch_389 [Salmonella phage Munch]EAZ2022679.1 hypothetical protein [Salmonella enterica]ECV9083813.1 hypothetical protein [Salmonella enterica subsp. enterica serovar Infantis]MCP0435595.1 hypothetical protein [Salmonella enterica subsp. enterica serovar Mbandaka]EHX8550620.1 hypothetical protein [Salmonella enterica]